MGRTRAATGSDGEHEALPAGDPSAGETSTRRSELLSLLRSLQQPASITDLAARIGVHPNTVRFHLEALTETRQVERVSVARKGPGRPALMFQAHRGMDPAGPRNYRMLAEILVADIETHEDPARHAVQVGAAWGAKLGLGLAAQADNARDAPKTAGVVHQLMSLLDEAGFAPELSRRRSEVSLRHCPFLELASEEHGNGRPAVVCALHLGLLQGAAGELTSSPIVEGLDPFVEPDRCVVRLASLQ